MHKKTTKRLSKNAGLWIHKPYSALERMHRDVVKRLPPYQVMIAALLGVFAFHPKVYAQG